MNPALKSVVVNYRFYCRHYLFRTLRNIKMPVNTDIKRDYIYVAFPDKPVYLKRCALVRDETESTIGGDVSICLNDKTSCFFVYPSDSSFKSGKDVYIQSANKCHKVFRQSTAWTHANFAHSVQFSGKSLSPGGTDIKRGVCLYLANDGEHGYNFVESILSFVKTDQSLCAYELKKIDNTGSFKLTCLTEIACQDTHVFYKQVCRDSIQGLQERAKVVSPIFAIDNISPVFHSYIEARKVLDELVDTPEVQELMDIADKYVSMETLKSPDQTLTHPFVVVEGMDATGKTTLTEALENQLGAVRYYTPPPQITHLRAFFDRYPEIVRRAYYSMGNYIVAKDIIRECQTRPVIMDRFWHSTTAYGIANETSSGDLPEAGNNVYKWPTDLLKPTVVLFLTVTEVVRKQRLSGRGIQATFEEKSLDRDQLFRQRLCECYRRMSDPACVEIDAGGTVDEVRNTAITYLHERGVKLN